jgi:hypothetical protein
MRSLPLLMTCITLLALSGCGETTLKSDSRIDMRMSEPMRIEIAMAEPIKVDVNIQGPAIVYEGTFVSEELMEQVDVDKTTAEWVLAVVGEPDQRNAVSDGSEIWRWAYRPTRQQGSFVNFLGGDDPQPHHILAYVRVRNGIVIEKWRG